MRLVRSDTRAFIVAVVAIFLLVIIIAWLHVFVHALLIVSASLLCTLDARASGLSETQTFCLLSIVSLAGLGLGGLTQQLYLQALS